MRILLLSDLHLEHGNSLKFPPGLILDVVLLGGDIHSPGHDAVQWAQLETTFNGKPVLYVPGNHEFYGAPHLDHELDRMSRAAEGSNVHLLNRTSKIIDGVRFVGCILWTDFQMPIQLREGLDTDVALALEVANGSLNDFRLIEVLAPATRAMRHRELKRLLRAEDTLSMHWVDRDWLRRELKKPFDGQTVVVTHHAPSSGSVAAKYAGGALTPAFASHLPDSFFESPALWVHGHTHTAADYMRGSCRIMSNPRGYLRRDSSFENGLFNASMVVDLADPARPAKEMALASPN